jgi:2-polyprenyl-3-methyl-5-hydroxy-6-metoxy-1,4-benzoquinol methylase
MLEDGVAASWIRRPMRCSTGASSYNAGSLGGTSKEDTMSDAPRFGFGANWKGYRRLVGEDQIRAAEASLTRWYGDGLRDSTFLDVGCGSGLFSLAARRLGATVRSFDYDSDSVAATRSLKDELLPDDDGWIIERGSILDRGYLASLGRVDHVYSWGVLHHTGDMWTALENTCRLVRAGGLLWVAIYDDVGRSSRRWLKVKRLYNRSPQPVRYLLLGAAAIRLWIPAAIRRLSKGEPLERRGSRERGMDAWYDLVDWVGGYPFEVARVDALAEFFLARRFEIVHIRAEIRGSNNELLVRAPASEPEAAVPPP